MARLGRKEYLKVKRMKEGLQTKYTGLFKMIVGVLTTCHTQYI